MSYKKEKRAIVGNLPVMMMATIAIVILLVIFLVIASLTNPLKKVDKETLSIKNKDMAYQSLKNYLKTEIEIEKNGIKGKIAIAELIDAFAFDSSLGDKLKQETENTLSPTFSNCYEVRIPYFNGKPYFASSGEAGYFSAGNSLTFDDYAEIIIPGSISREQKNIAVRLSLDTNCLGVENEEE
ncbi:hypothetical protein HZA33_01630 [Candidatus Pacearchaeota archaeon]|nr:hypothetical protein [Candidatus Pacearchaeota archaeon]